MEYSQTQSLQSSLQQYYCLNPYSNGILTDNLSESELHFQPSIFSYSLPTFYQEVKPMETFFSQMRRIEKRIPNKNGAFFKHLSGCQTLASSQDQTPSKLFPGFAKNAQKGDLQGAGYEYTTSQSGSGYGCFFANVATKNHKTNSCELFVCRIKTENRLNTLTVSLLTDL